MAVYFKFKSAKDFVSIPIDGHFISVANLKDRIFESKFGKGTGFDLIVANAQTNEDYLDEAMLIPKNTSLLVRRVPVQRRLPIVANPEEQKVENSKAEDEQQAKTTFPMVDSSVPRHPEETEWDEFGDDLYAIPEAMAVQSNIMVKDTPAFDKVDEDSKIKALVDSSALDWQMKPQDAFGASRGFGRGMGGRMIGGRGFGRGFERSTPPQGYICHRCEVPGHFIQHCPTNGDPNFEKRRMKNPTGIPKDMLVVTANGSYSMPDGAVAVMKPNEAAFDREVEGLSCTRSVGELPPELHCPLCKEVMKDAVLTGKCCFSSFCDKCIRDYIISKSMCVCGAANVLADDLLPNKTVRDTINRILESNNSSTENAGSVLQIQDNVSARTDHSKAPSPTVSATSKGGRLPHSPKEYVPEFKEAANGQPVNPPQQSLEKGKAAKAADRSEVTLESMHEKEPKLLGSDSHAEEEVQQKQPSGEPGKRKKKKNTLFPVNEMQWGAPQKHLTENCMMPFAQPAYDPYWGGMQFGMNSYMAPYNPTMAPPYNPAMAPPFNHAMAPPYNGPMPPYNAAMAPPYNGTMPGMGYAPSQGYSMPNIPPHRDGSGFSMGFNHPPSTMSREDYDSQRAAPKRRPENDQHVQREANKDWENGRELSNNAVSSLKSKSRIRPQQMDQANRVEGIHARERLPREAEPVRYGKNKADHYDREAGEADTNHKNSSVFSRISYTEEGGSKKRKPSSSPTEKNTKLSNGYKDSHLLDTSSRYRPSSNGHQDDWKSTREGERGASNEGRRKNVMAIEHDSSDDEEDKHFKRRSKRYESQPLERDNEARATRSSREDTNRSRGHEHDRDFERQRGHNRGHSHSKSHGNSWQRSSSEAG